MKVFQLCNITCVYKPRNWSNKCDTTCSGC